MYRRERKPHFHIHPKQPKAPDDCWLNRFWARWGAHLDLSGGVACLAMLGTIIACGWHFISDTQAANKLTTTNTNDIQLLKAQMARFGGDIEILMQHQGLRPLSKSDQEIQLQEGKEYGNFH